MNEHEKINYLAFPARNLELTRAFFSNVFQWEFTDYGPEYTAFSNAGIEGGFFRSELFSSSQNGGALVVFYSRDLEGTQEKILKFGGRIVKPRFSFPGGSRFHFEDPNGNEFAVWSENSK